MQSTMLKAIVEDFGNGGTIDGDLVVSGDLQVSGGGSLSFDEIVSGTQVVEITNTEAFLVRKASDGGDVFIVDTTNSRVGVGISPTVDLDISSPSGNVQARLFRNANVKTSLTFKNSLQEWEIGNSVGDNNKFTIRDITDSRNAFVIDGSGDTSFSGTATVAGGILTLGTADTSSGHINAFENMSFNIDTDNDDTNRFFEFSINGSSGSGTELMRLTEAGQLGIGTTSPSHPLDVAGVIRTTGTGTNSSVRLNNTTSSTGNEWQLYSYNSGDFSIYETSDRLYIKSDGKIGIGTASPDTKLEISGSHISNIGLVHLDSSDHSFISLDAHSSSHDSGVLFQENGTTQMIIDHDGSANSMRFHNGSTTFMNIDSSGNVGIGDTTPDDKLSVYGGTEHIRVGSADANHLRIGRNTSTGAFEILRTLTGVTNQVIFQASEADSGNISFPNGSVGIGTASPGQLLHIQGNAGLSLLESTGVGQNAEFQFKTTARIFGIGQNIGTTGKFEIYDRTAGITRLAIDSSGSVGIGTTSPTASKLSISHANNTDYDSYKSNMGATASTHHAVNISNSSNEDNTNERYALLNFFSSYGNSASGQAIIGNVSTGSKQGNFIIGTRGGDSDANVTEKFRVTYDGNVGIGNSGTFDNPNSASKVLEIATSSPVGLILNDTRDANPFCIENRGAVLHFAHGTTSRLIIDDSGNVGIGASPQTGFTQNLTIEGASPALILRDSTSSNQATQFYTVYTANNAVKHYFDHAGSLNFASSTDYAGSGEAIRFKIDDNSRISLSNNDSGTNNTTFGYQSGLNLTTNGDENTLVGHASGVELTTGEHNVAVGHKSIFDFKEGSYNTAVGSFALGGSHGSTADASAENVAIGYSTMGNNFNNSATTDQCVAIGAFAMNGALNNVDGTVAVGYKSLLSLTSGVSNVAVGYQTGDGLTDGGNNVLIGYNANSAGGASASQNIGIGVNALLNASASNTVGIGYSALSALTSGERNTAVGFESLKSNTIGDKNTAVGYQALESFNADTDGHGHNTAVGHNAMQGNVTGTDNTAIGHMSAFSGTNNMTAGDNNTFVGSLTSPSSATPTNQTVIGYNAVGQGDNSVTLGNSSVTDVYMSEDSGARVHASGLTLKGQSNQILLHDTDEGDANDYFRVEHDGGAFRVDFFDHSTSTNNSNLLTVSSSGNASVLGTLSTNGILFPDSQSASSDANMLDDYEEGTWTPVLSDGTNNFTMVTNNNGNYTKVGRAVHFNAEFGTSSIGSASGALLLTGLPFTSAAVSTSEGCCNFGFIRKFDYSSNAIQLSAMVNGGATTISFFESVDDTNEVTVQCSQADNTGFFMRISGTYFV